jgi:plastocyanin
MMNSTPKWRTKMVCFSLALALLLPAACSCLGRAFPRLDIVSPSDGTIIASSNVSVTVSVENFNLADKIGQISGGQHEGHLIFYMDVSPPVHQGRTALTQRGSYTATTETSHTWENIRPGRHVLGVQMVTNNNEPLTVPRSLTIDVNVVIPPRQPTKADLIAYRDFFNVATLTVPAGAEVVLTFVNEDSTPHNVSIYDSAAATQALFKGEAITGPSSIVYRFTAPAIPGDYFFRSDVNPTAMTGTLRVTAD